MAAARVVAARCRCREVLLPRGVVAARVVAARVAGAMRVTAAVTGRDGLAAAIHADLRSVATWAFQLPQVRVVTVTKSM